MSPVKKRLVFTTLLALLALLGVVVVAGAQGYRQYYTSWSYHPTYRYYYRYYYYKPVPTYVAYKHHYVVYVPRVRRYATHLYFYNPYRKVYWGRCPARYEGEPGYSLLAEADRKGSIEQIPESAFPQPAAPPPVPESQDNVRMDLPPDDLPGDLQPTGG